MDSFKYELITESNYFSEDRNLTNSADFECIVEEILNFSNSFGIGLAVPEWEAILTAVILSVIILITVVGNILVILSVFTYKPLRIVQNFFIVSLAVADLTVAILVLPFNIAYSILGRWIFGSLFCKMWLTCDILCCTSSILNLCSIALDRYWAITNPIKYAQKRTLNRVLLMIFGVWILSLIISSPPLLGWNDWPDEFLPDTPCQLTSQRGYVIYSSLGSFFIPLLIMTIVYMKIFIATRRRLRQRAKASRINTVASMSNRQCKNSNKETAAQDHESVSSETNHNDIPVTINKVLKSRTIFKRKHKKKKPSQIEKSNAKLLPIMPNEDSVTDCLETRQRSDDLNDKNLEDYSASNVQLKLNDDVSRDVTVKILAAPEKKPSGVCQFIEEKQRISLSKERRAARTLGVIMGVFVVCWLPFFLMYVILPFCPECCPTNKFINFITWLGYINSTLNPLIYTIFNLDYRRAFKKLLRISS